MKIITYNDNDINANTYLIINNDEAIIIDPANDLTMIKKELASIKLVGIFLTHGHYDHFRKLEETLSLNDNIKVYMHKDAISKLKDVDKSCAKFFGITEGLNIDEDKIIKVYDNEVINIIGLDIKILALPGHTSCSVGYLISDNLFIGDVIFNYGIGRYDLPSSSYKDTINTLIKVSKLNQNLHIYPGHDNDFILKDGNYLFYINK